MTWCNTKYTSHINPELIIIPDFYKNINTKHKHYMLWYNIMLCSLNISFIQ